MPSTSSQDIDRQRNLLQVSESTAASEAGDLAVAAYHALPNFKELQAATLVDDASLRAALVVTTDAGGQAMLHVQHDLLAMRESVESLEHATRNDDHDLVNLSAPRQALARALHQNMTNDLSIMKHNVSIGDSLCNMALTIIDIVSKAGAAEQPAASSVTVEDVTDELSTLAIAAEPVEWITPAKVLNESGQTAASAEVAVTGTSLSARASGAVAPLVSAEQQMSLGRHSVSILQDVKAIHTQAAENIVRASDAISVAVREDGREFTENQALRASIDAVKAENARILRKLHAGQSIDDNVKQQKRNLAGVQQAADNIAPNSRTAATAQEVQDSWSNWQIAAAIVGAVAVVAVIVAIAAYPPLAPAVGKALLAVAARYAASKGKGGR